MDNYAILVLLVALVIGTLLRTYGPFAQKKAEAQKRGMPIAFDVGYIKTMVGAFVVALLTALTILPQAILDAPPDLSLVGLLVFGIFYAAGWTEVFNRYLYKWLWSKNPP